MIAASLDQQVRTRARDRCEYCLMHQALQGATFHIEHVVPKSRDGDTNLANLALACPGCNLHKSDRIEALDVITGDIVPIYDPRTCTWSEHFQIDKYVITGITPIGRATCELLTFNHP